MASHATSSVFPSELTASRKFENPRKLGEGGMGTVWRVRHSLLGKDVAIKVMSGPALVSAEARERFFTEMRAGGRLDHPNIARVIDANRVGDLLYLVMEYIEGISLDKQVMRGGPLSVRYACDFASQAALGLQHAFEKGMTHRDIKPANLLVTRDKQIILLDFGLVQLPEEGKERMTRHEVFMGTAEYVSPEQAQSARAADIRSDIYSLGCTLYFLLSGKPPFEGKSYFEVAAAHLKRQPRPLKDIPADLSAVLSKMMAKNPVDRYQTPAEVVEALRPFRETTKPTTFVSSPTTPTQLIEEIAPVAVGVGVVQDTLPSPKRRPRKSERKRRLWLVSALGALAALAVIISLLVFLLGPRYGELKVELNEPGETLEVKIDGEKVDPDIITKPIRLKTGSHWMTVTGDNFNPLTEAFTVKAGQIETVRLTLTRKLAHLAHNPPTPAKIAAPQDPPPEVPTPVPADEWSQGLIAELFEGQDFDRKVKTRIDRQLLFHWTVLTPDKDIKPGKFSIRWKGRLKPPKPWRYTLTVFADDGVRLWLDGKLLINQWHPGRVTPYSTTVYLGEKSHELQIDFYEVGIWRAILLFFWSQEGGFPDQPVPPEALTHQKSEALRAGAGEATTELTGVADAATAKHLRAEAYNDLAWRLATSPDANVRNGNRAVENARKACDLSDEKNPLYLDTLAAALAEEGRFPEAVEYQRKATDMVTGKDRADYQSRLKLYEASKPYRVP